MIVHDIKAIRTGNTFKGLNFEVVINNAPYPLAGVTIFCDFRYGSDDGKIVKQTEIGAGITVTDSAGGKFKIDQFDVDFKVGTIYYDVLVVKDGVKLTRAGGKWPILQASTIRKNG